MWFELGIQFAKLAFVLRFFMPTLLYIVLTPISGIMGIHYSNCWLYVINKYICKGGYIVFRRTKFHKNNIFIWEHALWTNDLKTFYSFIPREEYKKRFLPPLLFKGKVACKKFTHGELTEWIEFPEHTTRIG